MLLPPPLLPSLWQSPGSASVAGGTYLFGRAGGGDQHVNYVSGDAGEGGACHSPPEHDGPARVDVVLGPQVLVRP